MKVVLEHRTYEQRGNERIEIGAARRRHPFLHKLVALAAPAMILAGVAAVGIITASIVLILLPIAFLAAWWLQKVPPNKARKPQ